MCVFEYCIVAFVHTCSTTGIARHDLIRWRGRDRRGYREERGQWVIRLPKNITH